MPFPIAMLFLAAASGTTATATATASTAAIIGGVAAGAGGTVSAGAGIWYFFFKDSENPKPAPSAAHQQSMNKQNNMTKKKIDDAAAAVSYLKKDVKDSAVAVKTASGVVAGAAQNLHASVDSMTSIQQQLSEAAKKVATSTTVMSNSLPIVTDLAAKTEKGLGDVATRLETQTQKLEVHKADLVDAKEKIGKLTEIIDIQGRTVEQLTESVQLLSDENGELKTTITTQHQKYQKLEAAAKKTHENNRFFRQVIEESGKGAVLKPESQDASTQTCSK